MELRRVDMPPINGRMFISKDAQDIFTTSDGNKHTLGKIIYEGTTLYRMKMPAKMRHGYRQFNIVTDSGNRKHIGLHRIVAFAWCNPPENWAELDVDHIDGNPENNHADNLHWVTHQENLLLARERGSWGHMDRPVVCFETEERFNNVAEVFNKYKTKSQHSREGLYAALNGRQLTWHGLTFAYEDKASWL